MVWSYDMVWEKMCSRDVLKSNNNNDEDDEKN